VSGVETATVAFAVYGVGCQVALTGFFAARRWWPRGAEWLGWVAYAYASLGLALGGVFLLGGESWRLYLGPIVLALWAGFGLVVDIWPRLEWRRPVKWSVLIPYVALYFWGQMLLWWPLWDLWRAAWFVFLAFFAASTVLNLRGHFAETLRE
jgi:hypothetical protein